MVTIIPSASLARVPTGVDSLDRIIKGGLMLGGAYIVMGLPGVGKTTLGAQIAFHHVAGGERALYVTLLAETHSRMLQHMASFRFFDDKPIGRELTFVSAFNLLESEGLKGVLGLLQREVVDKKITLVVLDGLVTAEALAPSEIDIKKFVHELQALLILSGCTAILLTNPTGRTSYPAHTMVDGVFELRDDKVGLRAVRRLNLLKFRGSDSLRGEHAYDITAEGITVHPRLESLPAPPATGSRDSERILIGVPELDQMLGGGILSRSTTLVLGPTGSGKTLLGLRFLATGAERGEPVLYVGFSEGQEDLRRAATAVRIDLGRQLDDQQLEMRTILAAEAGVDELAEQILETVRTRRVSRLFFDGLNGLKAAASVPERVSAMFNALTVHLRSLGVTVMVSEDTYGLFGSSLSTPTPQVAARVDNIVLLRYVELRSQIHRLVSIIKARGSECDRDIREFVIGNQGIEVAATFESAEAVLGELPHSPNTKTSRKARPKSKAQGKGGARRRS